MHEDGLPEFSVADHDTPVGAQDELEALEDEEAL